MSIDECKLQSKWIGDEFITSESEENTMGSFVAFCNTELGFGVVEDI